jgi:hypothetical protein
VPSLRRGRVCSLQLLLALASAVILGSDSHGTHDHFILSHIRDSHDLAGQVPVFVSPRNRAAHLYPQALGSLFVASYDSQGYGGGIRTRLHTGGPTVNSLLTTLLITYRHGLQENTVPLLLFTGSCLSTGLHVTISYQYAR